MMYRDDAKRFHREAERHLMEGLDAANDRQWREAERLIQESLAYSALAANAIELADRLDPSFL